MLLLSLHRLRLRYPNTSAPVLLPRPRRPFHRTTPRLNKDKEGRRRPALGIRREDPARIWERRCPLTPEAVERLVHEDGVDVYVQPCERRVWKDGEFVKAGAKIHPTLSPADIILGIKETPLEEVLISPAPSSSSSHSNNMNTLRPRTHIMFSHTHKGQTYNTPLLSKFLASPSQSVEKTKTLATLIDWELLTDPNGKRTVGFGWFAGVAGALEGLVSTAHLHLNLGVASPFLGTPRPHTAPLPSLLSSLRNIGELIARDGTPRSMGPFIIVVTGSGQVSAGALHLLRETLPIQDVTVESLPRLIRDPDTSLDKIYLLHATQETYLFNRTTGERADRQSYYANPANFESRFHELIAPYMTLLINGVGWTPESPRLMSIEQTAAALARVWELQQELQNGNGNEQRGSLDADSDSYSGLSPRDVMKGRCQSYADVSCDIEGGLGFLTHASTLSQPSFTIDLQSSFPNLLLPPSPSPLPQLQMMSVDILPTALPLEASESFSKGIVPYVRNVANRYRYANVSTSTTSWQDGKTVEQLDENAEGTEIHAALERATIASEGKLRKRHVWLQGMVDVYRARSLSSSESAGSTSASDAGRTPANSTAAWSSSSSSQVQAAIPPRKRILLLGSGMVAGPAVEGICRRGDVELIVASDQPSRNTFLCNATPVTIDMSQRDKVGELIQNADVVISLLPVPLHPAVAELCIEHGRHLVTASYISPAMRALHDRAINSGVLLLNEIGLDPGIDHCSALSLLASLRKQKKKVVSFTSFCGGLPAPECADVPLKYKFSWSPRGVLSAALNGAQFLVYGKVQNVSSDDLLRSNIPQLPISDVLQLEGLPNRDSLSYSTTYDLHKSQGLRTLFRGTLRYPGFSSLLHSFKHLGLLDTEDTARKLQIHSYSDLIRASVEDLTGVAINANDSASFTSAIRDLIRSNNNESEEELEDLFEAIRWLSHPGGTGDYSSSSLRLPDPPKEAKAPIDLFATLLSHKLAYKPGERDLVVLHHEIITSSSSSYPQGQSHDTEAIEEEKEVHTSKLEVYGTPKHSAMSLCVGVPVALAALRVLDSLRVSGGGVGAELELGVCGPDDPAVYEYVLDRMKERGLEMKHRTKKLVGGKSERSVEGRLKEIWN
ncbi:uncharacterized protein FOMMEDRAFT_126943 [Fomitiporia mediterranea MF3/22]|uniref:uncharacterized protein n=1 Tax=Fomitiporia mediterranea (strain MF3/22) TaxID=694068 RepID=UPI0004407DFC|nr:uncharacterized protein FOMMEDRAFT_126943 [Fomitiporia mediterranea MF3/22]EJD00287.1 hypothetical protein FOMMEDRAFT_126943 [Fomitiporia mediterranea MF3/22]